MRYFFVMTKKPREETRTIRRLYGRAVPATNKTDLILRFSGEIANLAKEMAGMPQEELTKLIGFFSKNGFPSEAITAIQRRIAMAKRAKAGAYGAADSCAAAVQITESARSSKEMRSFLHALEQARRQGLLPKRK